MPYVPPYLKSVLNLYVQPSKTIYEADIALAVSRKLTELGFNFDDERCRREFYRTQMSVRIFNRHEQREAHFFYRELLIFSTIIK